MYSENLEFSYNMFYRFNGIKRYSIRLEELHSESNSEHTFMATVILARLMKKYNCQNYDLLMACLFHDAGELITGDINALCKTEKLKEAIDEIEAPLFRKLEKFFGYSAPTREQAYLLKAADSLCVVFYGRVNKNITIANQGFSEFKKFLKLFLQERKKEKKNEI